jgi:hypothetical protein
VRAAGEPVGGRALLATPHVERRAVDRHHALVAAVALEQLGRVAEEARVRHAVVLEHDALGLPLEEPRDRAAHGASAALVRGEEARRRRGFPRAFERNPPASLRELGIVRAPLARAVAREVDAARRRRIDPLQHRPPRIRAIEEEDQDGR